MNDFIGKVRSELVMEIAIFTFLLSILTITWWTLYTFSIVPGWLAPGNDWTVTVVHPLIFLLTTAIYTAIFYLLFEVLLWCYQTVRVIQESRNDE